jgi:hypothetical protein
MGQHNHSNANRDLHHQTTPKTTKNPSFRVYVDMNQTYYPNKSTVYTSEAKENKTCIDSLNDDTHYKFTCRCGCGARMAGFGGDIKAASRMGRDLKPELMISETVNYEALPVSGPVSLPNNSKVDADSIKITNVLNLQQPFVSDRYLKKALYGLSDDEINSYHVNKPDSLELLGVNLADRQPPAIGELVHSLVTQEGPYTLIEYKDQEIKLDNGNLSRVLCGICRKGSGEYTSIPLADLTSCWDGYEVSVVNRLSYLSTLLIMAGVSISVASIAYFIL